MKYAIDEKLTLTIGGIPQAVRIRSTDAALPVLLFLHGGPGVCDRHWVLRDQSALAEVATMVCWDQRGAGLSWSRKLKSGGALVFELGEGQAEPVDALMKQHGFEKIRTEVDFGGCHRAIIGTML